MIRRPRILIVSILIAQLVCVISCVVWYAGWQDSAWREMELARSTAYSRGVAEHTATAIGKALEQMPSEAVEDRDLLAQHVLETVPLSDKWRASVIDEDGTLIADPRLAEEPSLRQAHPGHWLIESGGRVAPLMQFLRNYPNSTVAGKAQSGDVSQIMAATGIPGSSLSVVVHTAADEAVLPAAANAAPFRRVGVSIAFVLLMLTGIVTVRLVDRYESRLSVLNRQLEEKVFKRTSALVQTRDAVMFGLARLAESRDQETGEHIYRMQKLSALLAKKLSESVPEIDEAWVERVRLAAALHDVGKVGVPDAILLKPGPLTPAERRIMQNHTLLGAECLAAICERLGENDFLAMAREIALSHHERWDGSGYPHGLTGEEIPLAARIVAVADIYDAACTARVYKPAKSHEVVRDLIADLRSDKLDPAVVDAFLAIEDEFRLTLEAELQSGGTGDGDPSASDADDARLCASSTVN